ncbi:hypothetical protein HPB50_000449 [Hyalomma asiaticum]|uniref:Uncharacterized protein n=1 Tax=Hyalomma asiaticum TaxID=266040 RepID=A0ACB7TA59_HYAAI|nr:hypothetical protein HPB50_000449 [Hyalomma asiaticum]
MAEFAFKVVVCVSSACKSASRGADDNFSGHSPSASFPAGRHKHANDGGAMLDVPAICTRLRHRTRSALSNPPPASLLLSSPPVFLLAGTVAYIAGHRRQSGVWRRTCGVCRVPGHFAPFSRALRGQCAYCKPSSSYWPPLPTLDLTCDQASRRLRNAPRSARASRSAWCRRHVTAALRPVALFACARGNTVAAECGVLPRWEASSERQSCAPGSERFQDHELSFRAATVTQALTRAPARLTAVPPRALLQSLTPVEISRLPCALTAW